MKRFISLTLASALLLMPVTAKAPTNDGAPMMLLLFYKCVAISGLGGAAYLVYRCERDWWLVQHPAENDGDDPSWYASNATPRTLAKNGGDFRCIGSFKSREVPEFWAWCNNQTPKQPMFPCSTAGNIPTGPVWTNYLLSGTSPAPAPSTPIASFSGEEDGPVAFAVVPAAGTNGMSPASIKAILGANCIVTNTSPSAFFTIGYAH